MTKQIPPISGTICSDSYSNFPHMAEILTAHVSNGRAWADEWGLAISVQKFTLTLRDAESEPESLSRSDF